MAFLGSVGKFLSGAAKPLLQAVVPAAAGFVTGGPKGAALGVVGSFLPGAGSGPPEYGGVQQLPSIFSTLGGAYPAPQSYPQQYPTSPVAQPVSTGQAVALTQDIFNIIVKLAGRLGIVIRTPGAVVRIGRNTIAKLLRFARANPGLTIINLLLNLGLAGDEATRLIAWYSTYGKRHRRIKVTNVKALNRSVRRLEGFRRLSHRVEAALTRRGVSRSSTRVRRCSRCRKNPCCC